MVLEFGARLNGGPDLRCVRTRAKGLVNRGRGMQGTGLVSSSSCFDRTCHYTSRTAVLRPVDVTGLATTALEKRPVDVQQQRLTVGVAPQVKLPEGELLHLPCRFNQPWSSSCALSAQKQKMIYKCAWCVLFCVCVYVCLSSSYQYLTMLSPFNNTLLTQATPSTFHPSFYFMYHLTPRLTRLMSSKPAV